MYTTIVKKFTGLLAVYIVIIVGIFVAQFKWPKPIFVPKEHPQQELHSQQKKRDNRVLDQKQRHASAKTKSPQKEAAAEAMVPFTFSAMTAANTHLPVAITSLSSSEIYNKTLSQVEDALISSFIAASTEDITEEDATAFVAANAKKMNLNEAIARVPPQIRHASYRTYLSAPYFGSLTSTYRSLESALSNCRDTLAAVKGNSERAIASLDAERMADYILLNSKAENVLSALKAISTAETLSVENATSVLLSYSALCNSSNTSLPALLENVIPKCFNTIEAHIMADNGTLSVTDVENAMSAIRTGASLIKAGGAAGNDNAVATGRALVNAYVTSDMTLHQLSELEVLLSSPTHYPHLVVLDDGIYAFTCADSIKYVAGSTDINIEIEAKDMTTHYMIINGIKPFVSIYIYNLPYHTDQRFETYNSSGFVYVPNTSTLLLKSRHKMPDETIRLVYNSTSPETAQ